MVRLKYLSLAIPLYLASAAAGQSIIQRGGGGGGGGSSSTETDKPIHSEDYLWTYFETPLTETVQYNEGHLGPLHWKNLPIPNNQCGGAGQVDGFGQSPIIIPFSKVNSTCESNLDGFESRSGNCRWLDLEYPILKSGLVIRPKLKNPDDDTSAPVCSMGTFKIPDSDGMFEITELRLKMGAEHVSEGLTFPNELELFADEIDGDFKAAFSVPIIVSFTEPDNPLLDDMINGWKNSFWSRWTYCAENKDGSGVFNVNTVLKEQQKLVVCEEVDTIQQAEVYIPYGTRPSSYAVQNFVQELVDFARNHMYSAGLFSYKGSLNRPPCTENVYWNIAVVPMTISLLQETIIMTLSNCFKEESTCAFASAASEFGYTTRPPQLLKGRQIIRRCDSGSDVRVQLEGEVPESERVNYSPPVPSRPYNALLFPFFVVALSLIIFYVLTRYIHMVPYTAVLFLLGTVVGIFWRLSQANKDQLSESTDMFVGIDGNLLLLTFLPGLLFKDAYCLDIHLFYKAFTQVLIMGFPMVLAGTVLMAVFAFYVLPYDWTFNFCMTFGAIVSATDPVAVAALLHELGAPPRLKTHISGESLLNDGAAIVFFKIFESLYLEEVLLGGEDIGLGKGISLFIQMSIGAAALGIVFGALLALVLYFLNRRFNGEEKIVQVSATFCMAYLSFFVAEAVLHWSGVISVVFCGLTTKAVANSLIIDHDMMDKFWALIEHLLNTVLFTTAGLVWGTLLGMDPYDNKQFTGNDWWFLILTYVVMMVVRFLLFGLFFPLITRIGLKSKWKEMVFQAFGGLRGAVGIALAILINHEVKSATVVIDPRRDAGSELFGIVGGITLLTLFINGTACGPLLKYLKLNRSTKQRMDILKRYDALLKKHVLDSLIELLGESYYENIDFAVITRHVPQLANLTYKEIRASIKRVKYTTPTHLYQPPHLEVFKSLVSEEEYDKLKSVAQMKLFERINSEFVSMIVTSMPDELNDDNDDEHCQEDEYRELRLVYIELLRRAYETAKEKGEIDIRDLLVVSVLNSSISISEDEVSNGESIKDWDACQAAKKMFERFEGTASKVNLITAFIAGHMEAENVFRFKVHHTGFLSPVERAVLAESSAQVTLAYDALNDIDPIKLRKILSLKLCGILVQGVAIKISNLVKTGLLKEEEGEHYLEHLEKDVKAITREQQRKKTKGMATDNRGSFLKIDMDERVISGAS